MAKTRMYRVVNSANGLAARLADITEADGTSCMGILFDVEGGSRFDLLEAVLVKGMCELHARRFQIKNWQGAFRLQAADMGEAK